MFNDVADKVFIDQAFSLLAGIHQALFTDPVDPVQTATFCGQQGRISRTVRAILNGQPGISAGQRVVRPTDQYCSLFQQKAMLSQSVQ